MKKMASLLTQQLLRNDIIPESLKEVYQYGIEILLSSSLTALSILLLAIFLGSIKIGLWFLVISIPLKVTVGGYHASTYLKCYLISNLEYIFQTLAIRVLSSIPKLFWVALLSGSIFYILFNSPVRNIHHPISNSVLKKNQQRSIFILGVDSILFIILYILKKYLYVYWGIFCIFTIALFIMSAKWKKGGIGHGSS